jgi:hypothetical protein
VALEPFGGLVFRSPSRQDQRGDGGRYRKRFRMREQLDLDAEIRPQLGPKVPKRVGQPDD